MDEKIYYIQNYYEGDVDRSTNIKIVDKGNTLFIQGYEKDVEIAKDKVKILIYGSFILDAGYYVTFVDTSNKNEWIGIPLAVGLTGYGKARTYARKAQKILNKKFLEDVLVISYHDADKPFII